MADAKISELTPATTVGVLDSFVVVQTGETRKISPAVLFGQIPSGVYCRETPEVLSSGAVSLLLLTSVINSAADVNQTLTLAGGTHGQEKEIFVSVLASARTATLNVTGGKGFTTIVFSGYGESVKLKNISGFWYVVSVRGATIA